MFFQRFNTLCFVFRDAPEAVSTLPTMFWIFLPWEAPPFPVSIELWEYSVHQQHIQILSKFSMHANIFG